MKDALRDAGVQELKKGRRRKHKEEFRNFWVGAVIFAFALTLHLSSDRDAATEYLTKTLGGLSFGIMIAALPGLSSLDSWLNTKKGTTSMRAAGAIVALTSIIVHAFRRD